jgi:hypothetical protein
MNVTDALERIGAIHEQLAKAEVYRGYHPVGVALTGLLGLVAAAVQPLWVSPDDGGEFLRYWLLVGGACAVIAGAGPVLRAFRAEDEATRRRTWTVLGQFVPCLLAGAAVALALSRPELAPLGVALLPGLWAILFGLGIVASRPYLPRSSVWVAAWFVGAGFLVLLLAPPSGALLGWAIGVPFGVGQLAMGLVFHSARRPTEEVRP